MDVKRMNIIYSCLDLPMEIKDVVVEYDLEQGENLMKKKSRTSIIYKSLDLPIVIINLIVEYCILTKFDRFMLLIEATPKNQLVFELPTNPEGIFFSIKITRLADNQLLGDDGLSVFVKPLRLIDVHDVFSSSKTFWLRKYRSQHTIERYDEKLNKVLLKIE